jgi:hypothetical protein
MRGLRIFGILVEIRTAQISYGSEALPLHPICSFWFVILDGRYANMIWFTVRSLFMGVEYLHSVRYLHQVMNGLVRYYTQLYIFLPEII